MVEFRFQNSAIPFMRVAGTVALVDGKRVIQQITRVEIIDPRDAGLHILNLQTAPNPRASGDPQPYIGISDLPAPDPNSGLISVGPGDLVHAVTMPFALVWLSSISYGGGGVTLKGDLQLSRDTSVGGIGFALELGADNGIELGAFDQGVKAIHPGEHCRS
jgi:hypothetical protein